MREFLQNAKYTALILALVVVAGIVMLFIVNLLERWIGIESVGGILIALFVYLVYRQVKSARNELNNTEE
jgi:predicted ABC-type exoprotein transport system permease subunit